MKNWKDIAFDDETMWPQTRRVDLPAPHVDERGVIQPLVDFPMKNVSLIASAKRTVRSNHYHLTDWHFIYVLSGSFEYYFTPADSTELPRSITVRAGEMIFTPPMEAHATVFLEDSQLVVASRNPRDQVIYENDVRRVTLVDMPAST